MKTYYSLEELLMILDQDEVLAQCDETEAEKIIASAIYYNEEIEKQEWENLGLEMACGQHTEEEAIELLRKHDAPDGIIDTVRYEYGELKEIEEVRVCCLACGRETKAPIKEKSPLCFRCDSNY
ncbi:MAG: hypothetical protein CMH64_03065 [Nanoarchaeota archaeon]|jgi:hypothetical protein|nr:hypothetical protein [Nanoarchaeota archaeon]|tara:strand:- start:149 stop:520 length:372 start_codon:yes stop_codon:yes gene_type:complete